MYSCMTRGAVGWNLRREQQEAQDACLEFHLDYLFCYLYNNNLNICN